MSNNIIGASAFALLLLLLLLCASRITRLAILIMMELRKNWLTSEMDQSVGLTALALSPIELLVRRDLVVRSAEPR